MSLRAGASFRPMVGKVFLIVEEDALVEDVVVITMEVVEVEEEFELTQATIHTLFSASSAMSVGGLVQERMGPQGQ